MEIRRGIFLCIALVGMLFLPKSAYAESASEAAIKSGDAYYNMGQFDLAIIILYERH
jgi:hypothetical protein